MTRKSHPNKDVKEIDISQLQKIITGRVVPHIYSFVTNTLPNYLKVGDTYRAVEERLDEWRRHYKELKEVLRKPALVNDDVFFRDYAVHKYLQQKGILQVPFNPSKNVFSNEFFEGAKELDVDDAVEDIKKGYRKAGSYDYYTNFKERLSFSYERNQDYKPRDNQQQVLNTFRAAIKKKRKNLLMYAVMRFGKSITSIWAAKSINAKLIVIVSAKVDVLSEWKQTVESHKDFKGYRFLDRTDLKKGTKWSDFYNKKFKTGSGEEICTNIVLFLTLQDLAGSSEAVKNHHKILQKSKINLLIIDETHFGARAPVLGKILAGVKIDEEEKFSLGKRTEDPDDFGALDKLEAINAEITLHLSGTPYRILMGSEFTEEDIIAFVQFSDIYEAKLDWSKKNLDQDEWKNPYYGFPQMVRFAFNPNESSRQKLSSISGGKPADLFVPASVKNSGDYTKFVHEAEVIDLLRVLDGSKHDTNMLGLLDIETIKAGKLARHIVMVLPYRASCDALEELIKKNIKAFKNVGDYTVFNISGYNKKLNKPDDIKAAIQKAELAKEKTITLTVNRMLTGSTVPYWDTMIYLKSTTSPQEYDQAIFRLQSPWVEKYKDDRGEIVQLDMKPQTLLVDLDPTRMFHLQELKASIYGANTNIVGNENIEAFIKRELSVSPIIAVNAEGNKLVEVTPTNIIDLAREYASHRTIIEDVREIGIDASLKDDPVIYEFIKTLPELGGKNGLDIKPHQNESEEWDELPTAGESDEEGKPQPLPAQSNAEVDEDISSFEKRFRTYYVMIILFAFLSDTEEKTLTDVIENIEANEDNRRIARNLGLRKVDLMLIRNKINPFVLSSLDYKIQNADFRSYDNTITPVRHIEIAINKFGRLSEAEVFTPSSIVGQMYDAFEESFWQTAKEAKVLDIASKSGSFAKGFVEKVRQRGVKIEDIKNNFYSIPTSPAAYEFTRKMYQALGLNVDNIARHFTSFGLLKLDDAMIQFLFSQGKKFSDIRLADLKSYTKSSNQRPMKFTAVVGNPPYQINTDTNFATPVYHLFFEAAKNLGPNCVSMIHPARFLFNAGATPKEWNKKMLNDPHLSVVLYEPNSEKIFTGVDIKGGICVTFWNKNKSSGGLGGDFIARTELKSILEKTKIGGFDKIVGPRGETKLTIILDKKYPDDLRIAPNYFDRFPKVFKKQRESKTDIKIIGLENGKKRTERFVDRKKIEDPKLNKWKVFLSESNGSGIFGETLSTPIVGEPYVGCSYTFVQIGSFDSRSETENCIKYIKSKFCRAMLGTLKITQHNTRTVWRNVPVQDFTNEFDIDWSKSIPEIDKQLYKKYRLSKDEIDFIETHVKPMA